MKDTDGKYDPSRNFSTMLICLLRGKGSTKRGSRTEKAEDELLLQEELEDTSNKLTYLTTTPSCI